MNDQPALSADVLVTQSPSWERRGRWSPALIALAVVGSALVLALAFQQDEAGVALAREGFVKIRQGDLSDLRLAEAIGLAGLGLRTFLLPLLLIGVLLAIELAAGPARREPKNYRLMWMTQFAFIPLTTLVPILGRQLGWFTAEPLFSLEGETSLLATVAMFFALAFVADFFVYWSHRLMHAVPLLWKFHRVHHSPRDLDALHSLGHPLADVAHYLMVLVPASLLIGVDTSNLFVLVTVFAVHNTFIHMNVPVHFGPFGTVLSDNRFHFVHHSPAIEDRDKNFAGRFPVFDLVFGTYRKPSDGPLPATGLSEAEGTPTKFTHYLLASWPGGPEGDARARPEAA